MEVIMNRRLKRRRSLLRLFFRLILLGLVLAAGGAVALMSYAKMQGPPPLSVAQTTEYLAVDDTTIGESHRGQNRYFVPFNEISPLVVDATIAIEDRKFYDHLGFDPIRIGGAIVANLRSGARSQGASTITQQYARNLYLSHEKTWVRKWNELIYSLRLEMNYEKEQILEGYLNTIYYGHGAYGIEAASHHFFSKDSKDLTLAEASMLAGIPKGPSYYSPLMDEERAKARQELILDAMVETGSITSAEARVAKGQELIITGEKIVQGLQIGPYFQDLVEQQLIEEAGIEPARLEAGGLKVYTTLDPDMQEEAERWIKKEMPPIKAEALNQNLTDDERAALILQTALVAMDPRTGDVRALVGGRDYKQSQLNRTTQSKRHAGSTFKPFLYYAALENGSTPASTLLSEPSTFQIDEGRGSYSPSNFGENYANDFITLLQALAFSDNIYAVKTHLVLGTDKLIDVAQRVGIESPLREDASLALGTADVSLLEMVTGYSPFANGGQAVKPRFIRKVVDLNGRVLYESEPEKKQVLDPKLAFIMTDLMTGMFDPTLNAHASVTGGSVSHLVNRPVAGKSGSTKVDSWMIGYTPQLVTGVWVGYDKGESIHQSTEGQISKKIWANFTEHALKDELKLQFQKPRGVVAVEMNPQSGYLASETCPKSRVTYFVAGTEPTKTCPETAKPDGTDAIDEEQHEEERFIDKFFKWFGH
ncbi:penicillin-binding protein 1A [Alkalihalophilus lindianensis]|uniref:Penicillin-binding protein 1A n=1 Tax=Alkalihalophilus lindianensis TaxID=1630542 RepID=A0ABU3X9K3_9BACI|nr:penicillin-binding protein 1A [Alkalihalophilus lindianensis]MDV2684564.1 penicillin-binding protein 1A [Alkalihalophilus lindianensis]